MVGNHAQGLFRQVFQAGKVGGRVHQVLKKINIVIVMHTLHHRSDTLQPHAGIHRRLGQFVHLAISSTLILHKDNIPDLDKTVAVLFRAARRAAPYIFAVIVENLAARATRAGIAHGPEIVGGEFFALVVANADNAVSRHAHFVMPDFVSLFIVGVNGHQQFFLRNTQPVLIGQKCPAETDGIALEIITKREITQHFKKGMVARCIADVFQVIVLAAGAHTALR